MGQGRIRTLAVILAVLTVSGAVASVLSSWAAEFTKQDLQRWEQEFMSAVKEGDKLFHSDQLGSNKVSCAQCHPNGANTHPETYPKFQTQLGKVASLFEMVNWCIRNPLEGDPLAADDPKMTALSAYIAYERRGMPLEPGKH